MRILIISYFELKKISRDWRCILFFFLQPMIATILLGLTAYTHPENIKVAMFNVEQNQYSQKIENKVKETVQLKVKSMDSEQAVRDNLANDLSTLGIIINIKDDSNKVKGEIAFVENAVSPQISAEAKQKVVENIEDTVKDFIKDNSSFDIKQVVSTQADEKKQTVDQSISELKDKVNSLPLPSTALDELNKSIEQVKSDTSINTNGIVIDSSPIKLSSEENAKKPLKFLDYYAPAVIILLIIFIGMNQTSTAITQERESGTFERFFVTPYTKIQMVFGKMIAYMSLSILLAVIITTISTLAFHSATGPLLLVGLVTIITGLTAIALGLFISSLTYNAFESINASVLLFYVIIILTTLIFQPETMHPIAKFLSSAFPFTYSIRMMREVNLLELGFFGIWKGLAINVAYLFGLLFLSAILLKRRAN